VSPALMALLIETYIHNRCHSHGTRIWMGLVTSQGFVPLNHTLIEGVIKGLNQIGTN
jgi:hypothetical protein